MRKRDLAAAQKRAQKHLRKRDDIPNLPEHIALGVGNVLDASDRWQADVQIDVIIVGHLLELASMPDSATAIVTDISGGWTRVDVRLTRVVNRVEFRQLLKGLTSSRELDIRKWRPVV